MGSKYVIDKKSGSGSFDNYRKLGSDDPHKLEYVYFTQKFDSMKKKVIRLTVLRLNGKRDEKFSDSVVAVLMQDITNKHKVKDRKF